MDNPRAGAVAAWGNGVHVKNHPRTSLWNARSARIGELHHFWLRVEMRGHCWGHSRSEILKPSIQRVLRATRPIDEAVFMPEGNRLV